MLYTTVIARKSTSAKQGMLKKAKPFTARLDEEWILIYKESLNSRTEAIKREKQLKSFQGRKFIKQYIP